MKKKRAESSCRLRWEEEGSVRAFFLSAGTSSIGSAPENSLVISHPAISRRHAALSVTDTGIRIEDLGSKNGTYVNERRVETAELRDGEAFELGPLRFQVERLPEPDVRLAISLDGPSPAPETPAPIPTITATEAASGTGADRPLRFLALASRRLALDPGASADVLEDLRREYGARAACFFSLDAGREPVVHVVAGPVEALDNLAALSEAAAPLQSPQATPGLTTSTVHRGDRPLVAAFLALPHAGVLGLALLEPARLERELPWQVEVLLQLLSRPSQQRSRTTPARPHRTPSVLRFPESHVVGRSDPMRSLYAQLSQLAAADIPVLITGETGVGKEHVARIVHLSSPKRSCGPFLAINCAAVPADLLEAELFGIERGVATGVLPRPGQFLLAQGGVLFLDEIGEMPPNLQTKLLRTLQSLEVQAVGARRPVPVDVRLVAATNAKPEALLADGRLRRDLYYRIAAWTLNVAPLRERREDIPLLVERFVRRAAQEAGKRILGVTVRALERLVASPWPGNVRQLEHEVRRLVQICPDGAAIDSTVVEELGAGLPPPVESFSGDDDLSLVPRVENLERQLIKAALARTKGRRADAAALLGISRDGLRLKMERLGVEVPGA